MVRLENIFKSIEIEFNLKYKPYKSLVLSILLYGCETNTLLEKSKQKIRTFEAKAHREPQQTVRAA